MPRYTHKLTDSDLPDSLCEEPVGDAVENWSDVTCPDCLDIHEDETTCEGHESLAGEHMGEAVYCDGTCKTGAKR